MYVRRHRMEDGVGPHICSPGGSHSKIPQHGLTIMLNEQIIHESPLAKGVIESLRRLLITSSHVIPTLHMTAILPASLSDPLPSHLPLPLRKPPPKPPHRLILRLRLLLHLPLTPWIPSNREPVLRSGINHYLAVHTPLFFSRISRLSSTIFGPIMISLSPIARLNGRLIFSMSLRKSSPLGCTAKTQLTSVQVLSGKAVVPWVRAMACVPSQR